MEDLSLHILDIVENSISAGAGKIEIELREDPKRDLLEIEITDNGKGLDEDALKRVFDPFYTTKTVRKVGLGLSLFREAARMANGDITIQSVIGKGTKVKATFQHNHIDRKPLGDMGQTMISLIVGNPEIHFRFTHRMNGGECRMIDTEEFQVEHKGAPLSAYALASLLKKTLGRYNNLTGGTQNGGKQSC